MGGCLDEELHYNLNVSIVVVVFCFVGLLSGRRASFGFLLHKIEKKFRADYLLGVAPVQRVGVHLDDVPGGAPPLADRF